jgi:hypothetical protein
MCGSRSVGKPKERWIDAVITGARELIGTDVPKSLTLDRKM